MCVLAKCTYVRTYILYVCIAQAEYVCLQGRDPLHGLPRAKPVVFNGRINFLCFLPTNDINNMYPDWSLVDLLVAN